MKKLVLLLFAVVLFVTSTFAQVNSSHVYVSGYTRSNGTSVQGHYRTSANSSRSDNFSSKGNINPYTGAVGTRW